ncbi:hypothetical protein, partial [Enterobacter roggenkampii]|uniref:hypothetical protein n=1 Tax=Enterobacter roggenkampii TaxID=1812935 RepID=UPI0021ADFB30
MLLLITLKIIEKRRVITVTRLLNLLLINGFRRLNQNRGNDSNLLIVFYVQIMPDDFVMQLHR